MKLQSLSGEKLKKHLDKFLIDSWSTSAVSDFIRNEKAFEKKYIFRIRPKNKSLSSIIGDVYHKVLMHFFIKYRDEKVKMNIDELLNLAHVFLAKIGANTYRPQLNKTIEQLQLEALKCVNNALQFFLSEFSVYKEMIQEIIFIEEKFENFVSINDIEIPLPLRIRVDIVFIDKNGRLCILDHKAKKTWSKQNDIALKYGNQEVSYRLCIGEEIKKPKYEDLKKRYPKVNDGVYEFYFFENKYVKNRNGTRQIRRVENDKNALSLLEQILFEGIFRVIEAVSNPDYVYLMNPYDYFEDGGEIVEFWTKTHIEGLDGFPNVKPKVRKILENKKIQVRRSAISGLPKSIIKSFSEPKDFISFNLKNMENLSLQERIEHRLAVFNYPVKVEHKISGYSYDTYLIKTAAAVKTSGIFAYRMDIANALGVKDVRILKSLIEYNGDVYIAVEVEKKDRVNLSLNSAKRSTGNIFPLGKDNFGKTWEWSIDNPSTPHLMIAGASGSGKSVAIKSIIQVATEKGVEVSILDPKFEFLEYKEQATVLNELEDIENFMAAKVKEMDKIFKSSGAIGNSANKQLIIFDESADCFSRQSKEKRIVIDDEGFEVQKPEKRPEEGSGKEEIEELRKQWAAYHSGRKTLDPFFKTLEENTLILAQKARSAGIHLVLAAQRFSVKILTGDAKANFATRLCLTVASGVDSKVMLDQEGAEKLAGKGDALLSAPGISEPVRIQCFAS